MSENDLAALLDRLAADDAWRRPEAFVERAALANRLDLLLPADATSTLHNRAAPFLAAMQRLDERLFSRLRDAVREGRGADAMAPWLGEESPHGQHYDALDALLSGLFALAEPAAVAPLPPEMVFYQPTPARHIVDCVRRAGLGRNDVVLDLGSGLGHVAMLVNILTGARTMGVEREAGYVDSATRAARSLGLHEVTFRCADAREVAFDGVNVVYLFTPFVGRILAQVVSSLERAARTRQLRIVTLGPCSVTVARQSWLRADAPPTPDRVTVFRSISDVRG